MRKLCLFALALALLPAAAMGWDYRGNVASLTVENDCPWPLSVTVDEGSNTVVVQPGPAGGNVVPPNGDFAMQARHGNWSAVGRGPGARRMNFYIHHGMHYKLKFLPHANGYHHGVLAVIDDGHAQHSEHILDMGDRRPPPPPPPGSSNSPWYVDPRYTPTYGYDPDAQKGAEVGNELAGAVNDFLGHVFHIDQEQSQPTYVQPYQGW